MLPSAWPPLKALAGTAASPSPRPTSSVWTLRPAATLWNRLPSLSTPSSRAHYILQRLLSQPAPEYDARTSSTPSPNSFSLISWASTNEIAVGSIEPCFTPPSTSKDQPIQPGLAWPVFIVLPDNPSEIYLVQSSDTRLVSVAWSPDAFHFLAVVNTNKITIFAPVIENCLNVLEPVWSQEFKSALIFKWVHVPIKFKIETPHMVWNESFSFGRKFQPDMPAAAQSPYAKCSCLALSIDGTLIWMFLDSVTMQWKSMQGQIREEVPYCKADFCFPSYASAKIAVVPQNSPNCIIIYEVLADFVNQQLTLIPQSTSKIEIPVPNESRAFLQQTSTLKSLLFPGSNLNRNAQHAANSVNATSLSPRSKAMNNASDDVTQKPPCSPGCHAHPGHTTSASSVHTSSTPPQEEFSTWTSCHIDYDGPSAIKHVAFDPYDASVIFIIWTRSKVLSNGQRCSYLQRWKSTPQAVKFRCPFDVSRFYAPAEEQEVPQPNQQATQMQIDPYANNSLTDFDDINEEANFNGDYDMWEFGDSKTDNPQSASQLQQQQQHHHQHMDKMADGSEMDHEGSSGAQHPMSQEPHGQSEDTSSYIRNTSLIIDIWECTARTVIVASHLPANFAGAPESTHPSLYTSAASSSSSSSASAAPSSSSSPSQHQMDSVTQLKLGRNIITLTCLSGAILVFDAETLDIIIDYCTPHMSATQAAISNRSSLFKSPPQRQHASSSVDTNSSAMDHTSTPTTTISAATAANTLSTDHSNATLSKKRSLDSGHMSPGGWLSDVATSPFSPLSGLGYDLHAHSPTGPPLKKQKFEDGSDNITIDISNQAAANNSLPGTFSANVAPTSSFGYFATVSSNIAVDCCISPNQACLTVLYADLSVRVLHLAPLIRYRTTVLTSQQLCMQVVNMLEVSMLRRRTFWDILTVLMALPEESSIYNQQHLHRGVLILLSRDIERLEPRTSASPSWWRTSFELIKSALFRSSPDLSHNFMRSQCLLSLRRIVSYLSTIYRGGSWAKKILDAPTMDNPDVKLIFSQNADFSQDKSRIEKEEHANATPLHALRWIQAFTQWILSNLDGFIKRAKAHRMKKDAQQAQASSTASYFSNDISYSTAHMNATPSSSAYGTTESPATVAATPGGSSASGFTPGGTTSSLPTPGSAIQTPIGTINTPIGAINTPGGTTTTPVGSTAAAAARMMDSPNIVTPGTAATPGHSTTQNQSQDVQSCLLSLPSFFSQLPVLPETLEELLLVCPDSHVDFGLLLTVDVPLLLQLKEAILYFAMAIHLDNVHASGKEYLRAFPAPSFAVFHDVLHSQAVNMSLTTTKFMTEDWIANQVLPTFYNLKEIQFRQSTPDVTALDLTPSRLRFLEFNFFHGEPTDPTTLPLRDGRPFLIKSVANPAASLGFTPTNTTNTDSTSTSGTSRHHHHHHHSLMQTSSQQHHADHSPSQHSPSVTAQGARHFWHMVPSIGLPYVPTLAPDPVTLSEVKGEFCKRCMLCNRAASLHHRGADGFDFAKTCPLCFAPWQIVKNPFLMTKRPALTSTVSK